METKAIFDNTIQFLDKMLELRIQKHHCISSNIANAETPGYSRLKVEFEDRLREMGIGTSTVQTVTHPGHMPSTSLQAIKNFEADFYRVKDRSGIGDKNTVSLDQEMMELSENQIRFEAAILSLNKKFSMLKHVIQEKL